MIGYIIHLFHYCPYFVEDMSSVGYTDTDYWWELYLPVVLYVIGRMLKMTPVSF